MDDINIALLIDADNVSAKYIPLAQQILGIFPDAGHAAQ